jgi:protein HOOK3
MDDRKELDAFFHFFATFDLSRPVSNPSDLSDGAALSDILAIVYAIIQACLMLTRN